MKYITHKKKLEKELDEIYDKKSKQAYITNKT